MTASAVLDGDPVARGEDRFPALDGARALAATAVLVHHVAFWTGNYTPDPLGRVFARLDVGVPIFFVLSGFLLSRSLFLAAARGRPAPRTAAYLWRRALRILPAYWLTVAAALLLLPANADAGPAAWARHLTLTQIYGVGHLGDGLTHTWSLATEVAFYLLLPVAGGGLIRLARARPDRPVGVLVVLAGATVLGFAWVAWTWAVRPFPAAATDLWLPGYTGWFAGGMALAVLTAADPGWRPVRVARELGASLPTCWAAAGVLFWLATGAIAGPLGLAEPTAAQALVKNALYLEVAVLLVLPLVFGDHREGWVRPALASPAGRFLGEISYGLFLVHVVVLTGAYAALDLPLFGGSIVLVGLGVGAVSLLLAAALYLLVERPLRRWRHLVPGRAPAAPASGSSAATTAQTETSAST